MARYKSDKTALEHCLFPFLLCTVAKEAISAKGDRLAKITSVAFNIACKGKDVNKLLKRCARLSSEVMSPTEDKSTRKISGHKFILTLHSLMQNIIDGGYIPPKYVRDCFKPFLEIEANQDTTFDGKQISNEDWSKIKESADKIAVKIYDKLIELGYYR